MRCLFTISLFLGITAFSFGKIKPQTLLNEWNNKTLALDIRLSAVTQYAELMNEKTPSDSLILLANEIYTAASKTENPFFLGVAKYFMGEFEMNGSNFEKALSFYARAKIHFNKLDSLRWLAKTTNSEGVCFRQMGLKKEAIKSFKSALRSYEKMEDKQGASSGALNIGVIYADLEDWENSTFYTNKALSIIREIDDFEGLVYVYNNLGDNYCNLGLYEEAIKHLRLAKFYMNKIGHQYLKPGLNYTLGEAMFKLGQVDSGLFYIRKAITLVGASPPFFQTLVYSQGGILMVENGNYYEALSLCKRALKIGDQINSLMSLKSSCECLTQAHIGLNNGVKSMVFFKRLENINDSLNDEFARKKLFEMEFNEKFIKDSLAQVQAEATALELKKENEKALKRKNRIQYSLVVIAVLLLATIIAVATKYSISPKLASGLIFIFFILLFEFLLVVLDPWVDSISDGEVGWKIGINTAIALVLFGVHQVSEKWLKNALLKGDK